MGWTGGMFEFPEKTSKSEMAIEIFECLETDRGYYEPVSQPLVLKNITFESRDDAEEYLRYSDEARRHSRRNDFGVKFKAYPKAKPTVKMKDMERRIAELDVKYDEYAKAHAISTFKAEFVSCPNCKSKLRKNLLKSDVCPLCHADMRSTTTIDTLMRYRDKQKELRKLLEAEKKKQQKKAADKAEIMWLVKAELYLG